MSTFLKAPKTKAAQKTATFTGEGAYHGSTKKRDMPPQSIIVGEVAEATPYTLQKYADKKISNFGLFKAKFPNLYDIKMVLPTPTQEEIQNDAVTFVWCPIDLAIEEAGPLTKTVLVEMKKHLEGKKKFVYIDSKIQYFEAGDLAVDSKLWHVDGTIAVRDQRARDLGYSILHDMHARMTGFSDPPTYMAYQSSLHCATQFVVEPLEIYLPDCIPNFDLLDKTVREANPVVRSQPAGSIVRFDGLSLHRAVPATDSGWRLWIRCVETDRDVKLTSSIIECYGTVFKPNGV